MSSHIVSRRAVLRRALAGAAAIAVGMGRASADQAALERRRPVGLKLSCSSLAFSDLTWEAALGEIKRLGFRYADLAMFEGWAHVSPSALIDPEGHAKKITEECARLELEPIALDADFALGDRKQFPGLTVLDPAARKTILGHFERVVRCARAADVPLINVQPGKFIPDIPRAACLKNAIDMLTQMHAMAARPGLVLSFENHTGSIAQQPADGLEILDAIPGLRLNYDPSHVVANSISVEETLPLMPHVAHIGIRNAKPGSYNEPVEDGKLAYPIKPFIDAWRCARINAYVSVEYYEPAKRDSIPALKQVLEREGISVT